MVGRPYYRFQSGLLELMTARVVQPHSPASRTERTSREKQTEFYFCCVPSVVRNQPSISRALKREPQST